MFSPQSKSAAKAAHISAVPHWAGGPENLTSSHLAAIALVEAEMDLM